MRTFPKALSAFRTMVKERGARLRQLPFAELSLADHPFEHFVVGSNKAKIAIIVLPTPSGGIQVVVQGFLKHRFMPGSHVAMDGFYKYPDERIAAVRDEEYSDFG